MNNSSLAVPRSVAQHPLPGASSQRRAWARRLRSGMGYLLMSLLGILFSIPFFWSVSSSLKNDTDIFIFPPVWIPTHALWSNYPEALSYMNFDRLLRNTMVIALLNTVGVLFSLAFLVYEQTVSVSRAATSSLVFCSEQ